MADATGPEGMTAILLQLADLTASSPGSTSGRR
jgi:hypothetical protein